MVEHDLFRLYQRLQTRLHYHRFIQETLKPLRETLQVDRVLIYHFSQKWRGQVLFEAISEDKWSIVGSSGPDQCFTQDYAQLYLEGRIKATDDIETDTLEDCHREFLNNLGVKSNLVIPIIIFDRLWGLLIAHQCHCKHTWNKEEIQLMQTTADDLSHSPLLQSFALKL